MNKILPVVVILLIVAIVYTGYRITEKYKERPDFGDVNAGDWYFDWVYGAVDLGLVNGKGKGNDGRDRFDPLGQITFAETAKLAACRCLRIWQVPISYYPRNYRDGKKITWRDGLAAMWHIFRFNVLADYRKFYVRDWESLLAEIKAAEASADE